MNLLLSRSTKIVICLSLMLSLLSMYIIVPEKVEADMNNPVLNGRTPGFLNVYKEVKNSGYHRINGNADIKPHDDLFMTISDVQISGANSGSGQTVIYSIAKENSNNGFPYIDKSELNQWVAAFGGNQSFMTNANGLYGHNVTSYQTSGDPYVGYLLSKIAEMSGGRGLTPGFTTIGNPNTTDENVPVYKSFVRFETTPRPEGDVGVGGKTNYNVGDTVPINFWAKDYSYFDRGINVLNYYVYNLDTNQVEQQFKEEIGEHNDSRSSGGGTSSSYQLTVGGQKFVPTKPGRYEARLLITDLHMRNSQNAPAVGGPGVAYVKPFTVGGGMCTQIESTVKISGKPDQTLTSGGTYKLPQGKNTISSLTFPAAGTLKVNGAVVGTGTTFSNILIDKDSTATFTPTDKTKCEWTFQFFAADPISATCANCKGILNVQTYTASEKGELNAPVASGGTQFVANDADYLRIETTIPGKWYDASGQLIPMSANVRSTSYTELSFSQKSLTLKFVSDDGTYCWCKTIERKDSTNSSNSCPTVYREGTGVLEDGDIISDIRFGGELKLSATYIDTNRDKQSANLYWIIKKPDGTTVRQVWKENSKGKWKLYDNSFLNIPSTSGPTDQLVEFNQSGSYTISYSYENLTGEQYDDWRTNNCKWSVTVNIVNTSNALCSDFSYDVEVDGQKATLTGAGTQSSPYLLKVPKGEKNETVFRLLYKGRPKQAEGFFEVGSTAGKYWRWGDTFFYSFGPDEINVPEFYMVAYPTNKVECKTYFKIIWGDAIQFECDNVYLTAIVNGENKLLSGNGSAATPYKMELLLNKEYTIDFKALFNNNGAGSTDRFDKVAWELTDGKGTIFVGTGNSYTRMFKETKTGSYTLKLSVKGRGQSTPCPDKFLIIEFHSLTCKDLTIQYKFSTDSTWSQDSGDQMLHSPGYEYHKLVDENTGVKITVTSDNANPSPQNQLKVTWTVTETNTGKTIANESSTSTLLFEKNKIPAGHYLVKMKVTDTSNPAFAGCEVYISFYLTSKDSTCDQFYIHVYAFSNADQTIYTAQSFHNANGKTINVDKSTAMYLIAISKSPDDIDDGYGRGINVDWTVPSPWVYSPIFDENDVNWAVFQKTSIPVGTYRITGKLNDKSFSAKCNFEVTIVVGEKVEPEKPTPCTTCNPGGEVEGGKMKIKLYDSSNRLLVSTADGVWEREPARIEVEIDQVKLNSAFASVDGQIKKAIDEKKAELLANFPGPDYEQVKVTATPDTWNSRSNAKTTWPASTRLSVTGPGINKDFALNPKLERQSQQYDGTTTPTLTTWNQTLNSGDYVVQADSFVVDVPYQVAFAVTYQKCEQIDDPDWVVDPDDPDAEAPKIKKCTPGSDSATISNQFQINVQGDQTSFEVFEPNATGSLVHTNEWAEYHSRDRYANSQPNDFYAGERILTRIQFQPKHQHPFSQQYPKIIAASAWILEAGKANTSLQSNLSLQSYSPTLWKGDQQMIAKLGAREAGVDTSLMGDKQKGFQKGESYAVYFQVQFAYQVQKGFTYGNKVAQLGHDQQDYKSVFRIIANAWERQGIRNHTKQ